MSTISSHFSINHSLSLNSKHPSMDVAAEANDLKKEGLIGKDSMIGFGGESTSIIYWSEKEHSQWQAYQQEGTDAARQAAAYQKQMVSEQQGLVTDYLAQVAEVATVFNRLDLPDVTFHQVLDNAQAGRSIVDGIPDAYVDSIQKFWRDNQVQIEQLDSRYEALNAFPRDLESWLEQQDSVSDEVFQVVDRLKNAWVSMSKVDVGEDYRPNAVDIQVASDQDDNAAAQVIAKQESGLSLIRSMEQLSLKSAQYSYTSNSPTSDTSRLAGYAARELLSRQLQQTYQEMQTLSKNLFPEFGNRFGQSSGHANYSLQDMVDNYLAEKPMAMLDNGTLHPLADQIEAFWKENSAALEQYAARQHQLNELPQDFATYIKRNEKAIEQYLLENLDRFLNMTVKLDQ